MPRNRPPQPCFRPRRSRRRNPSDPLSPHLIPRFDSCCVAPPLRIFSPPLQDYGVARGSSRGSRISSPRKDKEVQVSLPLLIISSSVAYAYRCLLRTLQISMPQTSPPLSPTLPAKSDSDCKKTAEAAPEAKDKDRHRDKDKDKERERDRDKDRASSPSRRHRPKSECIASSILFFAILSPTYFFFSIACCSP